MSSDEDMDKSRKRFRPSSFASATPPLAKRRRLFDFSSQHFAAAELVLYCIFIVHEMNSVLIERNVRRGRRGTQMRYTLPVIKSSI